MPLTLTIRNARLDNGSPQSLILDRRGAIIGRAATVDWCLPDPTMHVSSRHCEVQYAGDGYVLADTSTNGTFLQGNEARLVAPHLIQSGDVFVIGQYEVAASLDAETAAAMAQNNAAPPAPEWQGWAGSGGGGAPAASASGWDAVPTASAISGAGPMSQSWAPPGAAVSEAASQAPLAAAAPAGGGWGTSPAPPPTPAASGWGSPAPQQPAVETASTWQSAPAPQSPASGWSAPVAATPAPASADDVWGKIAASNVVDWARGGFGSPAASPPPIVAAPAALPDTPPPAFAAADVPAAVTMLPSPVASRPVPTPPAAASSSGSADMAPFLAAIGLDATQLKRDQAGTLAQAGDLLRRLVGGLVIMMEARARAKSQMGAAGTSLEFDGNNPLKFARAPEQALAQLLNPPERGFMPAERAIEDAFRDLQAHQIATLRAMQGALRSTLDRFSPTAIRARADTKGLLGKIMPGARDAALWQAYEREFGGVAQGSDEAFMDVFAKEFRKAYEDAARKQP